MKKVKMILMISIISLCPLLAGAEFDDFFIKLPCKGVRTSTIRLDFVGSNPRPDTIFSKEIPVRFYPQYDANRDNDPLKWWSSIPEKGKVIYKNIYEGVDIICYRDNKLLNYDIVLSPWIDPAVIRLKMSNSDCGPLKEKMTAYQYVVGVRIDVPVDVYENDDGTWSFRVVRYDKSRDLMIPSTVVIAEL